MHTNFNAKKKKMADSVCHNGNTEKMPKTENEMFVESLINKMK